MNSLIYPLHTLTAGRTRLGIMTGVLVVSALAFTGCASKIQKLSGFRSAVGFATLTASPSVYDFGSVTLHALSSSHTITFTNEIVSGQGAGTVTCTSPTLSNGVDFQIVSSSCGTLQEGTSCSVTVTSQPSARGLRESDLSLSCSDVRGTSQTISSRLRTSGVEIVLAVTPMTYDFGNVYLGANSATVDFTFTNTGNIPATSCAAPTITDTTNFTLVANTCSTNNLVAGGTCMASIRANPTSSGALATTLSRTCTVGGTTSTTNNQLIVNGVSVNLAWSPLTHGFGSTPIGTNAGSQVFTLTNSGGAIASGCSAPSLTDATNFTVTADTCGTSDLAAFVGTCTITVRGNPTTAGAKTTTLSRACTFGGTASTTANQITVTGTAASLAWTPLTKDFGDVDVGANSATQTFTLTNSGGASATGCSAPSVTDTTNFTITSDTCGTADLAGASATCTVAVRTNPTTLGAKATTLSRVCTFGGTVSTTANQIVTVGRQVSLAFDFLTHNFGSVNVGANSANQVFTLENFGNKTATGCSAPALSNSTDFSIVSETCGTANVAAAATCTVTVRANPATSGAKTTTLSRTCTAGGTPATTTNGLTTNAVAPSLAWSPMTNDFGNVNVGSNSATQTFTLTNSGTAAATGCSAPSITDITHFTIVTDNCGVADLAGASATCTVIVRGNPTTSGAKATTLSRTCTFGGTATTTTNQIIVTGITPSLAWTPLTHTFGSVNVGSASGTQTFTLTNSGTATATGCSAPTVVTPTEFTITTDNCSTNDLAGSGGTCTVIVQANPTTAGAKNTALTRTCTFGGTAATTSHQITVTGIAPVLAWFPLVKDFGNIDVGANSATQTFILTNSGTASATGCSAPSITDTTNFTIATDNCGTADLAGASATCTVLIRGNPTSAGAKNTTLSRTCTFGGTVATTTNQIVVTGVQPVLAWSPLTNDFGNVNLGSSSANQTFTLTNSGGSTATGCSAPSITDTTNFTIATDNCGTNTLAGGSATCTVLIHANPTTNGVKTTTLSRTCTWGGTASTTALQIVTTGISPTLAWSPLTKDFGNVNVGSNSATQTFTLTNSGTATATGCSAPSIADTTNFTITADNCTTNTLAGGTTTCTVDVRANPASSGAKATTLSRTCTFGGTASTTSNQIVTVGLYPSLAWSGLTKDFGNLEYAYGKSASTIFTLTNSGNGDATGCSAPTLTGVDPTEFEISIDNCGTSSVTASGGTCTVNVRANLTGAGLKTATLSRTCSFGGAVTTTANQIRATGVATSINLVARSESDETFGDVTLGKYTATKDVIFGNTGTTSAAGCGAPTLADSTHFSIVSHDCGATLSSGAHCTAHVRGKPTSTGLKTTALSMSCTGGSASITLDVESQDSATLVQMAPGFPTIYRMSDGKIRYSGWGNRVLFPVLSNAFTDAIKVTTGSGFFCGIHTGGTIGCLGSNNYGQLGDTTNNANYGSPNLVSGITNAIDISANSYGNHACAVLATGEVNCWGYNSEGQLGDGTTANSSIPVAVVGISTAIAVSVGIEHSCALLLNGTMQCWGANGEGKLGDGTTVNRHTPVTVKASAGVDLTGVTAILASDFLVSCAIISGGTVKCWGNGGYGMIGDGVTDEQFYATEAVSGITTATQLTSGYINVCALLADGTVKCWGENNSGSLGDGTTTASWVPVTVTGISGATQISSSWLTNCALLSSGEAKCWGEDANGNTGNGKFGDRTIAAQKPSITNATQISVGAEGACARISDGTAKCWGIWSSNGEAGSGYVNPTAPTDLTGDTNVTAVASANTTNCVLLSTGAVKCRGYGALHQRGDGTTTSGAAVSTVTDITTATQIVAGQEHFCARLSDGTAKCWGDNANYQLGDGTQTSPTTPVVVAGLSGVTTLYGGRGEHVCALLSNGDVKCWGKNNHGQLGDGTTTSTGTPTLVPGLHNVSSLELGYAHTCAVLTDGTARCWGYNNFGQLGDGTTNESHVPVNVNWYSNFASLSAGPSHTCGRLTDGKVRCWGNSSEGNLGAGDHSNESNIGLTAVFSLTGITQVASGADGWGGNSAANCAIGTAGAVWCWGTDSVGIPDLSVRSVSGFIP